MSIAVYPGSFDPITLGHVDLIRRLQPHYERLVVLVADAENKSYIFSTSERVELIREALGGDVEVTCHKGLTVNYANEIGANVIVRGIRGMGDMENEMAMANINRKLAPGIETMVVMAAPEFTSISSRLVKEVAKHNGDLSAFVPNNVSDAIRLKLNQNG